MDPRSKPTGPLTPPSGAPAPSGLDDLPAAAPAKAYRATPITLPDTNDTVALALARGLPMLEDEDDTAAVLQVFANRKLEKAALAAVPPDVRERYERLAEKFEEAPRVHLGMQLDLLRGKLAENPVITGLKPGDDGQVDWAADITLGEAAVGWLQGKVKDAAQYGEKRLGAPWAERPAPKAPLTDDEVAAKLANDSFVAPKFQQAYGKLPAEPKARYDRLVAALGERAGAVRRVEAMLVDGRMTGNKDLKGGATLLENLETLATGPLAPELAPRRGELVAAVVREIHEPGAVVQRDRFACGGATIQGFIAANNPAEYVRLVLGLAGPEGKAGMQNGGMLKRDAYFLGAEAPGLSLSGLLTQPAFVQRGATGRFALKPVPTPIAGLDAVMPGMSPHAVAGVLGELTGLERRPVWRDPSAAIAAHEAASPFRPIPALVNFPAPTPDAPDAVAPHWVAVTAVDKAKGAVTYRTQLGREETVARAEFDRHVYAVVAPGGSSAMMDAIKA